MPVMGRRISDLTRQRAGNLMAGDDQLADALAPADPGTTPDEGNDSVLAVDVGVELTL